ncbi:MAG: protein-export chaperone SecB [Acetobacteraceae bacterium]
MGETTPQATPVGTLPLTVNLQYIKDLSFEVPGGPQIFTQLRTAPQVTISMDVQARRLQEGQPTFEVALVVRAEAKLAAPGNGQAQGEQPVVFIVELTYAGIFTLGAMPENAIEPVLLVECPRLLFPFARGIVSDLTRDGGFPPVMLAPVDFVALWQSRRQVAGANQVSPPEVPS